MDTKVVLFLVAIVYSFIGLVLYYSGEIFIAIREIALNTRDKSASNKENYGGLELLQRLLRILGIMTIVGAWIVFFWVAAGSRTRFWTQF